MDINITALLYLFLRLAPFILVSFFSLSSIFNHDFKGVVYLLGLLASNVIVLTIENVMPPYIITPPNQKDMTCDFLNISSSSPMSSLPLGTGIIAYTLSYLAFVIVKYSYIMSNIATFILLSSLLVSDFIWHTQHSCFNIQTMIFTIFCFSACGILCAWFVDHLKLVDLQYFMGVNGQEICSRPARQSFKCEKKKM